MTYEEKEKRINEIIDLLESGELPLKESENVFEEAARLIEENVKDIKSAKGKITVVRDRLNQLIEEDFKQ